MRKLIGILGVCFASLNLYWIAYETVLTIHHANEVTPETVFFEIAKGQAQERNAKQAKGAELEIISNEGGFSNFRTLPVIRWIGTFLHLCLACVAMVACFLLIIRPKHLALAKQT